MFTLISPGIGLDWDQHKRCIESDFKNIFYDLMYILSHLRKCDSWLLIWSKIFFVDKMAVFPYQTKSWIIPHLNHIRHCGGCVKSKPNQLILHFTTCKNHTVHCVWLQNVIKVMIIKMWSWKRSTWSSQLTALLTQKWWLVDWCLDSIFHFSVGAQCQAVELFWKQKSHQMGFDLIVVSRGKSGIRICLKIS